MTGADDPGRDARLAEIAERADRRARLAARHGMPERISNSDALAAVRNAGADVSPYAAADDWIHASIYRDAAAADAWMESNRVHHGHTTMARAPLPDGRVVGILDLRAALKDHRGHDRGLTARKRGRGAPPPSASS